MCCWARARANTHTYTHTYIEMNKSTDIHTPRTSHVLGQCPAPQGLREARHLLRPVVPVEERGAGQGEVGGGGGADAWVGGGGDGE